VTTGAGGGGGTYTGGGGGVVGFLASAAIAIITPVIKPANRILAELSVACTFVTAIARARAAIADRISTP